MSLDTLIAEKQDEDVQVDVLAGGGLDALIASKGGAIDNRREIANSLYEHILFSGEDVDQFDPIQQSQAATLILDGLEQEGDNARIKTENRFMLSHLFDIPLEDVQFLETAMLKNLYGEQLADISSSVVNRNLKDDSINALKEIPENLRIGVVGMAASTLEAIKRRAIGLSGGGLLPDSDEAVKRQFEAFTPSPTPQADGLSFDSDRVDRIRQDFFPQRRLPGAIASQAVGVVSRLPDMGAKILRSKQRDLQEEQDIATMDNAPITKLARSVVQSGIPSVGVAAGVSILTGNPLIGLVILGETEGGAAFQTQLDEGGSVRKALIIGELSEAAEIAGESLVFPKLVTGLKKGISLRAGLSLVGENAGQEGVTGFMQSFLEVYGKETTNGTPVKEAASKAFAAGVAAIPENAFVGGVVGGLVGGVSTITSVPGKLKAKNQIKTGLTEQGVTKKDAATIANDVVDSDGKVAEDLINKMNDDAKRRAFTGMVVAKERIFPSMVPRVLSDELEAAREAELEPTPPPVAETPTQPTDIAPKAVEAKPEAVEDLGEAEAAVVEGGISETERNKQIKRIRQEIETHPAFEAAKEGEERLFEVVQGGPFFVSPENRGDVEAITGRPGEKGFNRALHNKFTFERGKGVPFDEVVQEILTVEDPLTGEADTSADINITDFVELVADSLEAGKQKAGISPGLLQKAIDIGGPEVELLADILSDIESFKSVAEINQRIREVGEFERADVSRLLLPELSEQQLEIERQKARAKDIGVEALKREGKKQPGVTKAEKKIVGKGRVEIVKKAQRKGEKVGFKLGFRAGTAEGRAKARLALTRLKISERLTQKRRVTARELVKRFVAKEDQGKFLNRLTQKSIPLSQEKAIKDAIQAGIDRADRQDSVNKLKTAAKAINPKKMLPEFAGTAQAIKDSLQIGKPQAESIAKTSEIKAMAQQVLNTARDDSVAAIQAQRVLDELSDKTAKTFAINQLSKEAIDQITDTLIALRFQNEADTIAAKDENATEAIRRRRLITESIVEIPDVPESLGGKGVRKFKALHDNLESVLDAVAGARPGTFDLWLKSKNPTTQFIYDVLDAGVDQQILHSEKARDIMRDILEKNDVTQKDILNWSMRPEDVSKVKKAFGIAPNPKVHKFTLKNAKGVSTKFNFTTNEIMSIFMHSRNAYNLDVLMNDGLNRIVDGKKQKIRGFTVDIVDDMVASLTDQQKNVARQVSTRLMDGLNKEAGNKVSVKLEFFEILRVNNYWPANRSVIKGPKGKLPTGLTKTIESLAFLKERVGIGKPLKFAGFFETVHNVNKNMASYVGLAEPLREVKAVYTPDVIEALEDDNRGDQANAITKLIERFEDPSVRIEGAVDKVVARMLGGFAKSKLFLNAKIAPRQQLSSFLISAYVDPKFITEFKGVGTAELRAEIKTLSPQFGARESGLQFDRDTGDAFVENELMNYLTGDTSAIDKTAIGIKFFDTNAIVDIYRATKAEVIDAGVNVNTPEGKAILKDRFEWVARHTQPMWHPKDRSLLGSDPRPLVRTFTMFMSQREQMIRMVNNGIADFANSEKTTEDQVRLGRSLGAVALNMVLFTIYNAAWAVLIQKRKKDVLDLLRDVFSDAISLPFFGTYFSKLFELIFNTFADKPTFHQFDFDDGPIIGILQEILLEGVGGFARAGKHMVTGEKYRAGPNRGELKWKNEMLVATDALVDGFASLKGIPYHGAKDIVKSVKAQFTEQERKRR